MFDISNLGDLSASSISLVKNILEESLLDPVELRKQVVSYGQVIDDAARKRGDLDVNLAECISQSCLSLLDELGSNYSEAHHQLVQLACRYFVIEEDDMDSVYGFDDDAQILNSVAEQLNRTDLTVQI